MRPRGSSANQRAVEPASIVQSPVVRINFDLKLFVHTGQLLPVHGLIGLVTIAAVVAAAVAAADD